MTDRVVHSELERELQLGADAVGADTSTGSRNFLETSKKRRRTLRSGEHFRPQRPLREGLDRLDQRVAGIDVHSGVAVK